MIWTAGAIATLVVGIVSAIAGVASTAITNKKNRETYLDVQQQNHELNEQAADRADERTRALYNDLESPAAKVAQLKQAGLSPGLIYGGGGSIGTGQVTSGAQAAPAQGAAFNQGMDIAGLMTSMSAFTSAMTNKDNSDTDTKLKKTQMQKLTAETDLIHEQIKSEKNEQALTGWKYAKTAQVSYSVLQSWSEGKSTSFNAAIGGSTSTSWGGGASGAGTGGNLQHSTSESSNESQGASAGRNSSKSNNESKTTSVILVPSIKNGECDKINVYIIENDYKKTTLTDWNNEHERAKKDVEEQGQNADVKVEKTFNNEVPVVIHDNNGNILTNREIQVRYNYK